MAKGRPKPQLYAAHIGKGIFVGGAHGCGYQNPNTGESVYKRTLHITSDRIHVGSTRACGFCLEKVKRSTIKAPRCIKREINPVVFYDEGTPLSHSSTTLSALFDFFTNPVDDEVYVHCFEGITRGPLFGAFGYWARSWVLYTAVINGNRYVSIFDAYRKVAEETWRAREIAIEVCPAPFGDMIRFCERIEQSQ